MDSDAMRSALPHCIGSLIVAVEKMSLECEVVGREGEHLFIYSATLFLNLSSSLSLFSHETAINGITTINKLERNERKKRLSVLSHFFRLSHIA